MSLLDLREREPSLPAQLDLSVPAQRQMSHLVTRLASWCEAHCWLLVALISFLYGAGALLCARGRDLWFDELCTYYIARPSFGTAWQALLDGADVQPPLLHWLTHLSLVFFGDRVVALRLPAVAGFWLMSVCLFVMVARRCGSWYGLVAMLFPLTTAAFYYASEARSYGLELGFCALALVSWQAAAEQRRRPWSVAGLALGVALAVASHYYAVLLLIPLGAGELVRTWQRHRIDGAVWLALGSAALPVLAFWPVIQAGRSYSAHFWSVPTWSLVSEYLHFLFGTSMPPIAVGVLVLAFLAVVRSFQPAIGRSMIPIFPPHETVAVVGTLLIPVFGFFLAVGVTKAYQPRYVLPALLSVSIIYAALACVVARGRQRVGLLLTAMLAGAFLLQLNGMLGSYKAAREERVGFSQFLYGAGHADLPVVISSADQWIVLNHYNLNLRHRLVYLTDLAAPMRWWKNNAVDKCMLGVGPLIPGHLAPLTPYLASHPRFLLYSGKGWTGWITPELLHLGWRIELIRREAEQSIYLVESPHS